MKKNWILIFWILAVFIVCSCKSTNEKIVIKELDDHLFTMNGKIFDANELIEILKRISYPQKIEYIAIDKVSSKENKLIIDFIKKKFSNSNSKIVWIIPRSSTLKYKNSKDQEINNNCFENIEQDENFGTIKHNDNENDLDFD